MPRLGFTSLRISLGYILQAIMGRNNIPAPAAKQNQPVIIKPSRIVLVQFIVSALPFRFILRKEASLPVRRLSSADQEPLPVRHPLIPPGLGVFVRVDPDPPGVTPLPGVHPPV